MNPTRLAICCLSPLYVAFLAFIFLFLKPPPKSHDSTAPPSGPSSSVSPTSKETFAPFPITELADKLELEPIARAGLATVMNERFGQPGALKFWDALPIDYGVADNASGKAIGWKLNEGCETYTKHCASCHGTSGNGAGPKAGGLDPPPRDFRRGVFKWRSNYSAEGAFFGKPLRHDLAETIRLGIPGTAMRAFEELSNEEREALVEYVRWLAMRGEFETHLVRQLEEAINEGEVKEALAAGFEEHRERLSKTWIAAESESAILRPQKRPDATAESIASGKELFVRATAQCIKCHGADGKGAAIPMRDVWGNPNQPWDLTTGLMRGGISPEDLFRRIRAGIHGSAMPEYPERIVSDQDTWHLVNFVLSIAPESLRAKQVSRTPPPGKK